MPARSRKARQYRRDRRNLIKRLGRLVRWMQPGLVGRPDRELLAWRAGQDGFPQDPAGVRAWIRSSPVLPVRPANSWFWRPKRRGTRLRHAFRSGGPAGWLLLVGLSGGTHHRAASTIGSVLWRCLVEEGILEAWHWGRTGRVSCWGPARWWWREQDWRPTVVRLERAQVLPRVPLEVSNPDMRNDPEYVGHRLGQVRRLSFRQTRTAGYLRQLVRDRGLHAGGSLERDPGGQPVPLEGLQF